jgi:hypothetical protein
MPHAEGGRTLWLLSWLCGVLTLTALSLWLLGAARQLAAHSWTQSGLKQEVYQLVSALPVRLAIGAWPVVGYLLGTAITLLPAASDWVFAPLYGTMLGVMLNVVLGGFLLPLIRPLGLLVQNQGVQKELKLTDEQRQKAVQVGQKIEERYTQKLRDLHENLPDLSPEKGSAAYLELEKERTEETVKALADILTPEQMKRYQQIRLQVRRGLSAFEDPEVQQVLKLSDEQKEKIKIIVDDFRKMNNLEFQKELEGDLQKKVDLLKAWDAMGFASAVTEKTPALSKAYLEKVVAVLNDEQKKTWKEMTGEPFELS